MTVGRRVARWALLAVLALVVLLPALALAQVPREAYRYRADLVRSARLVWGLDAPVAAMAAQVHQESRWRPDARSAYAHGLAQFTPATAGWIAGQDEALAGADTGNPVWALRALARYDRWLIDRVVGRTECDRWWALLRAYNGGLGHWLKEARLSADPLGRVAVDTACGQASRSIRHCPENLGYPRLILTRWQPLYMGWGRGVKCA